MLIMKKLDGKVKLYLQEKDSYFSTFLVISTLFVRGGSIVTEDEEMKTKNQEEHIIRQAPTSSAYPE